MTKSGFSTFTVPNNVVLNTQEKVIGTWINGKDLYEITFSGTIKSTFDYSSTAWQKVYSMPGITCVEFTGWARYVNENGVAGRFPIPSTYVTGGINFALQGGYHETIGDVILLVVNSAYYNQPYNLTVRYYKN